MLKTDYIQGTATLYTVTRIECGCGCGTAQLKDVISASNEVYIKPIECISSMAISLDIWLLKMEVVKSSCVTGYRTDLSAYVFLSHRLYVVI